MKLLNFILSEERSNDTFLEFMGHLYRFLKKEFKVAYDKLEFKIQTKLEPESEKDLLYKQNRLPTYAAILELLGNRQKNKFYPANPSMWVVVLCSFLCITILLFVSILHSQEYVSSVHKQFCVAIIGSVLAIVFWIALFYKEKTYGYHTDIIRRNIVLGFWVFLFTEGLCFMSLFWTFFHAMLVASTHIGQFNPGQGVVNYYLNEPIKMHPSWGLFYFLEFLDSKLINLNTDDNLKNSFDHLLTVRFHFNLYDKGQLINPYGIPAVNTALLLASACILNASHVKIKGGKYLMSFFFLILTIIFGFIFLCIQFVEIKNCTLQYNDGVYACTFYSLTGLHGIHVILGVFALIMCLVNFIKGNYTRKRHDTYWCAIAYWHFVDIVWVLVYLLIYCWPSCFYYAEYIKHSYLGYRDHTLNINTPLFEKFLFIKIIELNFDLLANYVTVYSKVVSNFENKQFIFLADDHFTYNIIDKKNFLEKQISFDALFYNFLIFSHFDQLGLEKKKALQLLPYVMAMRFVKNWDHANVTSILALAIEEFRLERSKKLLSYINREKLPKYLTAYYEAFKDKTQQPIIDITEESSKKELKKSKYDGSDLISRWINTKRPVEIIKFKPIDFSKIAESSWYINSLNSRFKSDNENKELICATCEEAPKDYFFKSLVKRFTRDNFMYTLKASDGSLITATYKEHYERLLEEHSILKIGRKRDLLLYNINTLIRSMHKAIYVPPFVDFLQYELYTPSLYEIYVKQKEVLEYNTLIFLAYKEIYDNKRYINYEEISRDKDLHAICINVLHFAAFDYMKNWVHLDFTTWRGKIKFPILFILYHVNINWAFTFAARYTPYLIHNDFKCMWGDLLYTRKPKWFVTKKF